MKRNGRIWEKFCTLSCRQNGPWNRSVGSWDWRDSKDDNKLKLISLISLLNLDIWLLNHHELINMIEEKFENEKVILKLSLLST